MQGLSFCETNLRERIRKTRAYSHFALISDFAVQEGAGGMHGIQKFKKQIDSLGQCGIYSLFVI